MEDEFKGEEKPIFKIWSLGWCYDFQVEMSDGQLKCGTSDQEEGQRDGRWRGKQGKDWIEGKTRIWWEGKSQWKRHGWQGKDKMTLEVGVRKAVCVEIQQREATDSRAAKGPERVHRSSQDFAECCLEDGRWRSDGWGYSSPGRGSGRSTRQWALTTVSCGIPHSCPLFGAPQPGERSSESCGAGCLNLHCRMCQRGFLKLW